MEDLRQTLAKSGEEFTETEIKKMISRYDSDGDEEIDFWDFRRLMEDLNLF